MRACVHACSNIINTRTRRSSHSDTNVDRLSAYNASRHRVENNFGTFTLAIQRASIRRYHFFISQTPLLQHCCISAHYVFIQHRLQFMLFISLRVTVGVREVGKSNGCEKDLPPDDSSRTSD